MAGICPHFCHTYFRVKRVKLIRPKDTGGQYSHRPKSNQGGWAGLLDPWPGERGIVQSEKKNPVVLVWAEFAGQPRGGPGSLVLGGGFDCLHGLWQDGGEKSVLHPLPFPGLLARSLIHLVLSSCPSSSQPLRVHKHPVPWSSLAPGDIQSQKQLCSLWVSCFSCRLVHAAEACAVSQTGFFYFFFLRAADHVTAPTPHKAEVHVFRGLRMVSEMGKSQIRFWAGHKSPVYYLSIHLPGRIMKAQKYIIKLQTGVLYDNKVDKALLNQAKTACRTQILFLALSSIRGNSRQGLYSLCASQILIRLLKQSSDPKRSYWLKFQSRAFVSTVGWFLKRSD